MPFCRKSEINWPLWWVKWLATWKSISCTVFLYSFPFELRYGMLLCKSMFSRISRVFFIFSTSSCLHLSRECTSLIPKLSEGKIIKGNVIVTGRKSPNSLYETSLVSFDEKGDYNQKDAEGFIKINSIRLKNYYKK